MLLAAPDRVHAQTDGFEFTMSRWWADSVATTYGVGYQRGLLGPVGGSLGVAHLDDSRSPLDRTATGMDASIAIGRTGSGPYLMASASALVRHDGGNLDAQWSGGGGWAFRLLPYLSASLEVRYRVEDERLGGFWRLDPADRRGLAIGFRVVAGGAARRSAGGPTGAGPVFDPPSGDEVEGLARESGASAEAARLSRAVVETALRVMGTPYVWGGTDEGGYDCSGLIQYAYGEHGLILPRVSRDQARAGTTVEPRLETLRPGDILGFAAAGPGVSHVGLYVGEGQFIHSSSSGVRVSTLMATDPDGRWWRDRWVTARRIIQ